MELLKTFGSGSREPARGAPGRERRANGAPPADVDELISSLAESIGVLDEPSPSPPEPLVPRRKVRRTRPRILTRIPPVSLQDPLYIAAAIVLGAVIGILVPLLAR